MLNRMNNKGNSKHCHCIKLMRSMCTKMIIWKNKQKQQPQEGTHKHTIRKCVLAQNMCSFNIFIIVALGGSDCGGVEIAIDEMDC